MRVQKAQRISLRSHEGNAGVQLNYSRRFAQLQDRKVAPPRDRVRV